MIIENTEMNQNLVLTPMEGERLRLLIMKERRSCRQNITKRWL